MLLTPPIIAPISENLIELEIENRKLKRVSSKSSDTSELKSRAQELEEENNRLKMGAKVNKNMIRTLFASVSLTD